MHEDMTVCRRKRDAIYVSPQSVRIAQRGLIILIIIHHFVQ